MSNTLNSKVDQVQLLCKVTKTLQKNLVKKKKVIFKLISLNQELMNRQDLTTIQV